MWVDYEWYNTASGTSRSYSVVYICTVYCVLNDRCRASAEAAKYRLPKNTAAGISSHTPYFIFCLDQ
jgi:hypothetical protein